MFVEGMLECTTMCALAPSSSSLREGKKVGERVKWGGGREGGRGEGRKGGREEGSACVVKAGVPDRRDG